MHECAYPCVHGRNPDVDTVEGRLLEALQRAGCITADNSHPSKVRQCSPVLCEHVGPCPRVDICMHTVWGVSCGQNVCVVCVHVDVHMLTHTVDPLLKPCLNFAFVRVACYSKEEEFLCSSQFWGGIM